MFYSPSKEFVRFSTYRTAEIKALRERIQKEKVTQEQIDSTELRLQRLRQDYEQLQIEPVIVALSSAQNSKKSFITARGPLPISSRRKISVKRNWHVPSSSLTSSRRGE